jgi:hypothetical protein
MTTYVYETIPAKEGDSVEYFEIKQSMRDAPLTPRGARHRNLSSNSS